MSPCLFEVSPITWIYAGETSSRNKANGITRNFKQDEKRSRLLAVASRGNYGIGKSRFMIVAPAKRTQLLSYSELFPLPFNSSSVFNWSITVTSLRESMSWEAVEPAVQRWNISEMQRRSDAKASKAESMSANVWLSSRDISVVIMTGVCYDCD